VRYQGAIIEVRVDRQKVEFRVVSGPPVTVKVYGKNYVLDAKGVTVKLLQPVG
jgi:trehalose/maltose hydrolase-like predicted phosphorylase